MKVPPRDSGLLGRCRYVTSTLPKEFQDRLTLEFADEPLLAREEPVLRRTREASGFLQVKRQMLGLDGAIPG